MLTDKVYEYHPEHEVLAERAAERQATGRANPRPKNTRGPQYNEIEGSRWRQTQGQEKWTGM
eukprot:1055991-Amphidinium_carterae.1